MELLPAGGGGGGGVFFVLEYVFEAGNEGGTEFGSEGVLGAEDGGNGGARETGDGAIDGGMGGINSGFGTFDGGCAFGAGEDVFRLSSIMLLSSLLELMSARKGKEP